jgi:hypothetical protein
MDRCTFFNSISGILYPEMLVDFFDQFVALKQIVEDSGKVTVLESNENQIVFSIMFNSIEYKNIAMEMIQNAGYQIAIYGRIMNIRLEVLTDNEIKIIL